MLYTLVTLFPEWFASPLSTGLMAKAREAGVVDFAFANPRDTAAWTTALTAAAPAWC